jgi:hypothetical protein
MLEMNAFDTVCHEHMEYYGLSQVKWMADRVGFTIIDVEFNDVNGGSFSVTASKSHKKSVRANVEEILKRERELGLHTLVPYREFAERVAASKHRLREFLDAAHAKGETVAALGASTKGNVLLQYCDVTDKDFAFVGEVNPDKFGAYTPGSWIPIISEDDLLKRRPDYVVVLPWHFRRFFESSPRLAATTLVFPLPELSMVQARTEVVG